MQARSIAVGDAGSALAFLVGGAIRRDLIQAGIPRQQTAPPAGVVVHATVLTGLAGVGPASRDALTARIAGFAGGAAAVTRAIQAVLAPSAPAITAPLNTGACSLAGRTGIAGAIILPDMTTCLCINTANLNITGYIRIATQ